MRISPQVSAQQCQVLLAFILCVQVQLVNAWNLNIPISARSFSSARSIRCRSRNFCFRQPDRKSAPQHLLASVHGSDASKRVEIYDTTLTQRQVDLSPEDKLRIADRLCQFGMNYIEAGWPLIQPRDRVFFLRARSELKADVLDRLVALAEVPCREIESETKKVSASLLETGAGCFGLVMNVLSKDGAWISMESFEGLQSCVSDLKNNAPKKTIIVHLHNVFDAYREDSQRTLSLITRASQCGADTLVLADSSGGSTPWDLEVALADALTAISASASHGGPTARIGVNCQNDADLAVAATLHAVHAGAALVQGSINGADMSTNLCTVVPVLQLKMGLDLVPPASLADLTALSRFVDEQTNQQHRNNQPFVGHSAFAHKGGIHVAAVLKNEDTYQHIVPGLVGNQRRILISELSGRGNIMSKIEEFGMLGQGRRSTGSGPGAEAAAPSAGGGAVAEAEWRERSGAILQTVKKLEQKGYTFEGADASVDLLIRRLNQLGVKELEQKGYTFEGADASVDLMIRRSMPDYVPPFAIVEYAVHTHDDRPTAERVSRWLRGGAGEYGAKGRRSARCKAVVAVRVDEALECARRGDECDAEGNNFILEVARGNGPVDALDKALRRALLSTFPSLERLELCDYKVRILDTESATSAVVRVMIEFKLTGTDPSTPRNRVTWTTVSAGPNIIAASFAALVDGYEYHLSSERFAAAASSAAAADSADGGGGGVGGPRGGGGGGVGA